MSKYTWLFIIITLIVIITLGANQVESITTGINSIENPTTGDLEDASFIFSFFSTYISLLTFNVTGVPPVVSLLFIPMNLVFAYIIGEVIVKINPTLLAVAAGITALVAFFAG